MVFAPLSQGPFRLPQQAAADPPGYYAGWPLVGLGKRLTSALIDYVLVWVGMLVVMGVVHKGAAAADRRAGSATALWLVVVAYAVTYWNTSVRQDRSGQSLGKQLMGTRLVAVSNLGPPGKGACTLREVGHLFDIFCFGIGILAIAFSERRQSFGDRLGSTVVLNERKAGATIGWAVPSSPADALAPPEPQGGVAGWQPPSVWRRWLAKLHTPPAPPPHTRAPVILDAEPDGQRAPAGPALPTLGANEPVPKAPAPSKARTAPGPSSAGQPAPVDEKSPDAEAAARGDERAVGDGQPETRARLELPDPVGSRVRPPQDDLDPLPGTRDRAANPETAHGQRPSPAAHEAELEDVTSGSLAGRLAHKATERACPLPGISSLKTWCTR